MLLFTIQEEKTSFNNATYLNSSNNNNYFTLAKFWNSKLDEKTTTSSKSLCNTLIGKHTNTSQLQQQLKMNEQYVRLCV